MASLRCSAVKLLTRVSRPAWCRQSSNISVQQSRLQESSSVKRARLFYQSRKRGTLENGILLSSFTAKYLNDMNEKQLDQLDLLLNKTESDWQLYYWIIGREIAPKEFQGDVLQHLQTHCLQLNHSQNNLPQISSKHIYLD